MVSNELLLFTTKHDPPCYPYLRSFVAGGMEPQLTERAPGVSKIWSQRLWWRSYCCYVSSINLSHPLKWVNPRDVNFLVALQFITLLQETMSVIGGEASRVAPWLYHLNWTKVAIRRLKLLIIHRINRIISLCSVVTGSTNMSLVYSVSYSLNYCGKIDERK